MTLTVSRFIAYDGSGKVTEPGGGSGVLGRKSIENLFRADGGHDGRDPAAGLIINPVNQDHVIRAKRRQDAYVPVLFCVIHDNDFRPVRQRLFLFQQTPGKVAVARAAGAGVREQDQRFLAGLYPQRKSAVVILHQRQI